MRLILAFFLLAFALPASADWQSDLSTAFDIAITFDDCADWTPSTAYGMDNTSTSDMPVCTSSPPINYYSDWDSSAASAAYIQDFGSGYRVGSSGKSVKMDLGSAGDYGPSRLGGYFGDGNATSGYQEIYFFYRAYFPSGYFPSGLVYEKLGNIGHGFTGPLEWNGLSGSACNGDGESCRMPYGITSFVPQAEYSSHQLRLRSADYYTGTYPYEDEATSYYMTEGEWISFEYHIALDNGTADSDDIEVWAYGSEGTATLVFSDTGVRLHNLSASTGHGFNWFFIGGNQDAGGTLTYYVDDIIIDDARIGPTYFSMLSGSQLYCTDADSDGYYVSGSCASFGSDPGGTYILQSSASGVDCDDTTYDPTNSCETNDGLCGTNDGGYFTTLTSGDANNCTNGTVTSFTGTGPWSWSCVADTTDNCTANPIPVGGGTGQSVYSASKRINYSAGKYVRYAE